jgi:uncharacterized protein YndB with AHSA1/START domain
MKLPWLALSGVALGLAALATLLLSLSLADVYVIAVGKVAPGGPMPGDRWASSLPRAITTAVAAAGALFGAVALHRFARRKATGRIDAPPAAILPDPAEISSRARPMQITIEKFVHAPVDAAWRAWTTPADICQWNAASDDWHTPRATVDLRPGGAFSSRMEARDGSMGFDFAGTYTRIVEHELIEAAFGDRTLRVEFTPADGGVLVRETFDAESTHSIEQQRDGWQAILDRFARHVEAQAR